MLTGSERFWDSSGSTFLGEAVQMPNSVLAVCFEPAVQHCCCDTERGVSGLTGGCKAWHWSVHMTLSCPAL